MTKGLTDLHGDDAFVADALHGRGDQISYLGLAATPQQQNTGRDKETNIKKITEKGVEGEKVSAQNINALTQHVNPS